MKLIVPELELPADDPFANDRFNRKTFAERLTDIIMSVDHPVTLAIDAAWGEGKTTFAKMWEQHLANEKIPVEYFDAFKKDSSSDAFMALAAVFIKLAQDKESDETSLVDNLKLKAIRVAKAGIPLAVKTGISAATMGLFDGGKITDNTVKNITDKITNKIATEYSKKISEVAGLSAEHKVNEYLDKHLDEYMRDNENRTDFRMALMCLVEAYSKSDVDNKEKEIKKPLVIIIDELDRCRPPFALRILEAVKHYFDVPHIVFIFMLNGEQLENSIVTEYGGNENSAKMYLQKFFTARLLLPFHADAKNRQRCRSEYVSYVLEELNCENIKELKMLELSSHIGRLATRKKLALRTIEKICTEVVVISKFNSINLQADHQILVLLCCMRVLNDMLYKHAQEGKLSFEDAMSFCGLIKSEIFDEDIPIDYDIAQFELLRFLLDGKFRLTGEWINKWNILSEEFAFTDRSQIIPFYCRNYVDAFSKS